MKEVHRHHFQFEAQLLQTVNSLAVNFEPLHMARYRSVQGLVMLLIAPPSCLLPVAHHVHTVLVTSCNFSSFNHYEL